MGEQVLGINGSGRIGKLSIWHHVARKHFGKLVVNFGRKVGTELETVCAVLEKDSTYGSIHRFLFGVNAQPCIKIVDRERKLLEIAGVPVQILQEARNPQQIGWRQHGARVVVDCTGVFVDPTRPPDEPKGSLRGHLDAGAEYVINSSAFKIKEKGREMPHDAATLIFGINHHSFRPSDHRVISAASCTTTALAHMVKPLLDHLSVSAVMTASMSTVHAATNSQSVLDTVPSAGATDLRKTRSVLNNIILTSTNAAQALEQVIPAIGQVGFMADSVRIPTPTESLIILNITFQSHIEADGSSSITGEVLNRIYRDEAAGRQRGVLVFSEEQNVPIDVAGMRAAVVIEGHETHTRTGFLDVDLSRVPGVNLALLKEQSAPLIKIPVTHAKIFGWYDNEYGSYTSMLGDLTCHIQDSLD